MSAHKYEMMMIVDPQIEDASVKKLVNKYFEVITNAKGTIDKSDFWGRRKLAYPIDHKTEGTYVAMAYNSVCYNRKSYPLHSLIKSCRRILCYICARF